ncbi:MAG: hypothetical protein V7K90_19695 [Nostoc sp.]
MALRKAQRLMSPRSQPGGWERILRGGASRQERGGGASANGFPASRLGTSLGKDCILT